MKVEAWLCGLGLERYVQAFHDNDVDARTLRLLTEEDLVDIGVKSVGHRRRLAEAIAALAADGSPGPSPTPPPAQRVRGDAEQRQLSVLYCQMADSAESSGGPSNAEDRRRLIQGFQKACMLRVADYDGHVANFYGDCMLAYFGWPRAHEDDAERAVRAGLLLVREVQALQADSSLCAQVGIATGWVVVGDLIREGPAQEQSAVGMTPNLAARMLSLAGPGQVVFDELTRQLLAPSFVVQALGSHVLKGISAPVAAYAATGERPAETRFDARKGHDLAPMVGRDHELALLLERWEQAQRREGQAVLLVGEAGIGKSRIVRAVLDECAAQPHWRVRWQCSPYHAGSALWPVIQQLARAAGLDAQDSNAAALDKLEALTGQNREAVALYAVLLGLDGSERYGQSQMTPQLLRERTIELLAKQLFGRAKQRPLLLVVEDAHWIDPTTLELLERCLERIDGARMLIVITSRPDNQPKLGAHPSAMRLSLNRLGRASVQAIVAQLGGLGLQARTLAAIVAQTDGVPLFVEELTKAVLETGEAAIPASLHGSLMARLDRVPEVKAVAQVAACIGREFDAALLRAVAERPDAVGEALERLDAAELIFRRGDRSSERYTFKHALVQEAACESLLRARRRAIHARILQVLEDRKTTPSEILAHHAARAGDDSKALEHWRHAGDAALLKSAYHEASGYFSNAVGLAKGRPELGDSELLLQLRLGQAAMPAFGQAAPVTRQAFLRAYELLHRTSDPSLHLQVRFGVWIGLWASGEFARSLRLAEDWLAAVASSPEDPGRQVALRLAGTSHNLMGQLAEARAHLEQAVVLYDPLRHGRLTAQLGYEPGAVACGQLAWTLALLGSGRDAMAMLDRAQDLVSSQTHVAAKAVISALGCVCGSLWRDATLLERESTQLGDLASRHGLPGWQGYAHAYRGWHCLVLQQHAQAIVEFRRAIENLASTGTRLTLAYFAAGLALSLAATKRVDEASACIEQAIVECHQTGGRWCEAELLRVRGEVWLAAEQRDERGAMRSFEQALSVARSQGAGLWELRAGVSMARLWGDQGERRKAFDLLAPMCERFTEPFDAVDLTEARALLSGLRA